MMRALITGGTGMLGANLVRRLLADQCRVSVLARPSSKRTRLQVVESEIELHLADLDDATALRRIVDRVAPDAVFHLASTPFNPSSIAPEQHYRVNVLGTLALLDALRGVRSARIIFTGSAAAYGAGSQLGEDHPLKPATYLGASKAAVTLLLQTYARLTGASVTELRLFTPYGPWEQPSRLVPQSILAALANRDLPMSLGEQQRDFVYVDDVVEALVLAGRATLPPGTVLNIGSGVGIPIKQVVQQIFALTGSRARALLGALPTRPDEIMEMSADCRNAQQLLNWKATTTLEHGLEKTVSWVAAHRDLLQELCA